MSPFKTVIKGMDFIKEMLSIKCCPPDQQEDCKNWMKKTLIEELLATGCIEDIFGCIRESVEETESGLTMEEIERFLQSLNVMADCLETSQDWTMTQTIGALLAEIEDTKDKIHKKYIQTKVGEMKQRLDQARSAVKGSRKAAVKDEVHDESKKLGDDKL